MASSKILKSVNEYYTEKVTAHGATPKGVDWNGPESQELRFKVLLRILEKTKPGFSLLDYGCGYGAMYDYMCQYYTDFLYSGYDISDAMITEARKLHVNDKALWVSDQAELNPYDYVVVSGIFNVRL